MQWRPSTRGQSNLERLLRGITPKPLSSSLPPQGSEEDDSECFRLSDLWDCYEELSAYGLGSTVQLDNGQCVTQYFVPYLSAIEIYTNHKSPILSRNHSEVIESESECWSDNSGSSEKLSRSLSNDSSKTWDAVSEDSSFDHGHDNASPMMMRDKLGYIDLQYFDTTPPYMRLPFTSKINELAEKFPGLMSLKSVDISPASWMAVAWYPIYHIPSCKSAKDLKTCFLSYHTLSSCFQDSLVEGEDEEDTPGCLDVSMNNKRIPLSPFGLATYKMQGDLWGKPGSYDHERLLYLHSAADSWLRQLKVHHHDFNFFAISSNF